MTLEEITTEYEHPIIGVIGATVPLENYDSDDAYRLGYDLRELVDKKGTLFTGGVPGVGIDVYKGIIHYCLEKKVKDKFFILFPDMELEPPEEYFRLAEQTGGILNVEKAGKDMEERRNYVGGVADYLVVVNGSHGTIDEILKGLALEKPVICLENSGGAADVLAKVKRREIPQAVGINTGLIQIAESISDIIAYLSNSNFYKVLGDNK